MQNTVRPTLPMTADAFFAWAQTLPDGERYELYDGKPVKMPSERARHALCKLDVAFELQRSALPVSSALTVYPDGMAVQISDRTVLEPDAILAERLPDDFNTVRVQDALVVVEVLSPSTKTYDQRGKLPLYFELPILAHVLIVDSETHTVVRHTRDGGATTFGRGETMRLDPPGIAVDVSAFFRRVPRGR
ncbi:MAG: Uma2 family endonuclease [Pseudomonadota bacterium]